MSFSALVSALDSAVLSLLGSDRTVTIHSHTGLPDVTVPYLAKNPVYEEDFVPGSVTGTGNLPIFIKLSDAPNVADGDTATVNGVDYDVHVTVDREGGAHLGLRRRTQRWDQ